MNHPFRIISAEKLQKRWGVEPLDLYFLILHGRLQRVGMDLGEKDWSYIDWNDEVEGNISVFEDSTCNLSGYDFLTKDVQELERDHEINPTNFIRGQALGERWGTSEFELFDLAMDRKLIPIDPLGNPIDPNDIQHLFYNNFIKIFDLLYKQSDVEAFEKEFELPSAQTVETPRTRKLRPDQRHREAAREVAKELWKIDPSLTIADLIEHDEVNDQFEGRVWNDDTVRNWIKDLCPNRKPGRRPKKPTQG
jgi:hypothetical protein